MKKLDCEKYIYIYFFLLLSQRFGAIWNKADFFQTYSQSQITLYNVDEKHHTGAVHSSRKLLQSDQMFQALDGVGLYTQF